MDKMPIVAVIFQSIPEEIVLFAFALTIIGEQIRIKKLLAAAVMMAFVLYFARMLPLPFGVHTVIGVLAMIIIIRFLLKVETLSGIIATLFSIGTLLAIENVVTLPLISILGYDNPEQVWPNTILRIVAGWPSTFLQGGITYLLKIKKVVLFFENEATKR
ncbi:MAG: hypothetical protein C4589_05665 [Peptococcaceae bacterium]|nr:MAG: hypothetical protein C4589_05665 [Peptococcaceae bacterium]